MWEVWRVVLAKMATLSEVEREWSLCDLMDANEVLDMQEEMEEESAQEMKNKVGR